MISQFEKIKYQIEHGELLPMQVFEMMLEARGSTKPFRYGFKYDDGEYSSIIEETREQWLKLNYKGEIVALYDHPPAPAAGVPDDFLQKLGVWYAKLTNCDAVAADDGVHVGYCCPLAMMDEFESLLSAAPTPPGTEQSKDREALNYLMDRFDNEIYICCECGHEESTRYMDSAYYLRNYLSKSEQPDNAAPEKILSLGMDQSWPMIGCVQELIRAAGVLLDERGYDGHGHEFIREAQRQAQKHLAEFHPSPEAKPQRNTQQRITEQYARDIAESYFKYRRNKSANNIGSSFDDWFKDEGHTLLAKLNEHREPDYKAMADELVTVIKNIVPTELKSNHDGTVVAYGIGVGTWNELQAAIAKHEGGK